MIAIQMVGTVLVLFAACAASPFPRGSSKGWNELMQGDLFDTNLNTIRSKSNEHSVILDEFKSLLAQENVLVDLYHKFAKLHKKTHVLNGDLTRLNTFRKNLIEFVTENLKSIAKNEPQVWGVTQFADLTYEEFKSKYLHPNLDLVKTFNAKPAAPKQIRDNFTAPSSVDWRNTPGIVTSVKNQMQCGSCSIFSAVASTESANAIKSGNAAVSLSEQEIMDCASTVPATICDNNGGGTFEGDNIQYIIDNGVTTFDEYVYIGIKGSCANGGTSRAAYAVSWDQINSDGNPDENRIRDAVINQPLMVSIHVPDHHFMNFKSDTMVVLFPKCDGEPDHSITCIGYGTTDDGTDYWILKNSWDVTWGVQGYFYLARNYGNLCSIATGPLTVTV